MERGEGSNWFDTLLDEIGLSVVQADEAIQKNLESIGADIKELWSDFMKEMCEPSNLEIPEIFHPEECSSEDDEHVTEIIKTSEISDSEVQAKIENLGYEASNSDADGNFAMKYISAWFLHHSEEDCKAFGEAVASDLRSKGRLDLAAEVEKQLVHHFQVDRSTEALATCGSCHSRSVEDGEQTDHIDVSGKEQVLHLDGNHSEESIETVEEETVEMMRKRDEEGIKEMKTRLMFIFLSQDTELPSDEYMGMLEEQDETSDYKTCMLELDFESSKEGTWHSVDEDHVNANDESSDEAEAERYGWVLV